MISTHHRYRQIVHIRGKLIPERLQNLGVTEIAFVISVVLTRQHAKYSIYDVLIRFCTKFLDDNSLNVESHNKWRKCELKAHTLLTR